MLNKDKHEMGKITKKILREEFIGLPVTIRGARNRYNEGISGKITNETKHTITIKTRKGEKRIMKKGNTFEINLGERGIVRIQGDIICSRPEDRLKMRIR